MKLVGLINMNARLYGPVLARFISADTVVPDASTPLDYNRCMYVCGNPVAARDSENRDYLNQSPKNYKTIGEVFIKREWDYQSFNELVEGL